MNGDIEFTEEGTISEEKKQGRKILGVVISVLTLAVIAFSFSAFSVKNCLNEANSKTDELLRIGNSMIKNGYTGSVPNKAQTLSYTYNLCAQSNPLAYPYIAIFAFNFLLETLLVFLFLWLISKYDKASSLARASVVAFYFSILASLGTSFVAFQIILILGGFGVVTKMLHFDFIKRLLFITGLLFVQYAIVFLLLKFL